MEVDSFLENNYLNLDEPMYNLWVSALHQGILKKKNTIHIGKIDIISGNGTNYLREVTSLTCKTKRRYSLMKNLKKVFKKMFN